MRPVVCETRANVSRGWLARVAADPANPFGLWRREYLAGTAARHDGRDVIVYTSLAPDFYEAHSILRSREAQAVCFVVAAGGAIEVLGGRGDEGVVIARLNGLTPDELHDARESETGDDGLAWLEGTFRQVAWARTIRDGLVDEALGDGDDKLAAALRGVPRADWFIANRLRLTAELRERLGMPVR